MRKSVWKTLNWGGGCADGNGRRFEKELGPKTTLSNMEMEMGKGDGFL